MTLRQSNDGRWYGSMEVLLTRVVNGETEALVGHSPPFGQIAATCSDVKGKKWHIEKPQEWWRAQGWTITEPPILEEARRISRAARA